MAKTGCFPTKYLSEIERFFASISCDRYIHSAFREANNVDAVQFTETEQLLQDIGICNATIT
jgi:hypothetical protein